MQNYRFDTYSALRNKIQLPAQHLEKSIVCLAIYARKEQQRDILSVVNVLSKNNLHTLKDLLDCSWKQINDLANMSISQGLTLRELLIKAKEEPDRLLYFENASSPKKQPPIDANSIIIDTNRKMMKYSTTNRNDLMERMRIMGVIK